MRSGAAAPPPVPQGAEAATVVVRPYGNPLPLGFFSFGIGMALLGGLGLDLITGDQIRTAPSCWPSSCSPSNSSPRSWPF